MSDESEAQAGARQSRSIAFGSSIGVSIGIAVGIMTGNLGFWLGIGVAIGLGLGVSGVFAPRETEVE